MAYDSTTYRVTGADLTTYTGVTVDGVTTIFWGTEGLMASSTAINSGYYVVTDFREEVVEAFRENLPQGSGLTSTRVIGIDGMRWNITVRDDSRMTPPVTGTQVYLWDSAGWINSNMWYKGRVVSTNYGVTPKSAGEFQIVVERLTLVDA